jgi:hypothetical protein
LNASLKDLRADAVVECRDRDRLSRCISQNCHENSVLPQS